MKKYECACGHSVADHRTSFGRNSEKTGCSVPDCPCEIYERKEKAA